MLTVEVDVVEEVEELVVVDSVVLVAAGVVVVADESAGGEGAAAAAGSPEVRQDHGREELPELQELLAPPEQLEPQPVPCQEPHPECRSTPLI